jgi:NADH:ubiquinone oxidoreductase subunit 5 (subunit L)/multisubunit Na+/H+ antiporter MnhA subunit
MWVPLVILAALTIGAGLVGVTPEHGAFSSVLRSNLPPGGSTGVRELLSVPFALLPLGVAAVGIGLAYLSYTQWWDRPARFQSVYLLLFRRYFLDEIYHAVFLDGFRRVCRLLWTLDVRVIDGTVNGVVSLVRRSSTAASRWDGTVIDGVVNGAATLVVHAGAVSGRVDEKVVDGAVNTVADVVLGASATSARADRTLVDGAVDGMAGLVLRAGGLLRRLQTGVVQNYLLAMVVGIFVITVLFLMFR